MKTALTIAGSDSCGGAGIQADIKTMTVHGVYAMSAITALTAQNTTEVKRVVPVTPEFLGQQLDAVFEDIFPDAVKTGMLVSKEIIEKTAETLSFYGAKNIVTDPVMAASTGRGLTVVGFLEALKTKLLPVCTIVTPNIPEGEVLSGIKINSTEDMKRAAEFIGKSCGCAVLLKGGHFCGDPDDLLWENGSYKWFTGERVQNHNTHGTGCTLSSAIASNLAKGLSIEKAVSLAKEYLTEALKQNLDLGKGSGPLKHTLILNKYSD